MNLLILIFLTVSVYWHRTCCKTISTRDRIKPIPISMEPSTIKNIENHTKKQLSWENLLSNQNSSTIQELKRIANIRVDPLNRTSKILGSLAFLAGLSVDSLTNAPKSNVQSHTKFPSVPLNGKATQISPQIAAIYNPYSYLTHPYVLTAPLNIYSLWDPLRLQPFIGTHNNFQSLSEHLQSLNLADGNKQTDLLINNDEYAEENKKVENMKGSSEETDGENEESVEDDRVPEKKTSNSGCSAQKKINMQLRDVSKEYEDVDSSDQNVSTNTINKSKTHAAVSKNSAKNTTMNTTTNTTDNSTGIYNYTGHPFHGYYYGGYPQNINHIDFTTETNNYGYHTYDQNSYNLPTYNKPINFYSDPKYNYYSGDLYPSYQFHQEQIPEHFSNDFKRHAYPSDNTPIFSNSDFKPMI